MNTDCCLSAQHACRMGNVLPVCGPRTRDIEREITHTSHCTVYGSGSKMVSRPQKLIAKPACTMEKNNQHRKGTLALREGQEQNHLRHCHVLVFSKRVSLFPQRNDLFGSVSRKQLLMFFFESCCWTHGTGRMFAGPCLTDKKCRSIPSDLLTSASSRDQVA